MDELNNIGPKKKSIKPLLIIIILLMLASCAGGVYLGREYLSKQTKCKENKEAVKKEEPKKEETISYDLDMEEDNQLLENLNLLIQFTNERERKTNPNYYKFENLSNGEEVLNTPEKKFTFAFAYAYMYGKDKLVEIEVEKIGGEGATGAVAIPVQEMKRIYKGLYGEELPDSEKYNSTSSMIGEVKNDYVLGGFWTGSTGYFGTELSYNHIKRDGDKYEVVIDISYYNENYKRFEKSKDQLLLNLTKTEDGIYTINSMKISKK